MADFWQSPGVVTLHNLRQPSMETAAERVFALSAQRPVGTVVPVHQRDFAGPAMTTIVREIMQSGISANTILVLNQANAAEAEQASAAMAEVYPELRVLWAESPQIQPILHHAQQTFGVGARCGKGLACWLGLGYLLQCTDTAAVALQDADVENFTADMLAKLALPVLSPASAIEVAKAYYARTGDRMYGRLTRQFLMPFVHSMRVLFPGSAFASLLSQLRYPLSGEICMSRNFAANCRVPCGWSMEVSTLWDIQRMGMLHSFCQVEIADHYVHRHHPVAAGEPNGQTLKAMATEIGADLLAIFTQEGNILTPWHHNAFLENFRLFSRLFQNAYARDADFNGIPWNAETETESVREFECSAFEALGHFRRGPAEKPRLPSWNAMARSMPGCSELLSAACYSPGPARCAA